MQEHSSRARKEKKYAGRGFYGFSETRQAAVWAWICGPFPVRMPPRCEGYIHLRHNSLVPLRVDERKEAVLSGEVCYAFSTRCITEEVTGLGAIDACDVRQMCCCCCWLYNMHSGCVVL